MPPRLECGLRALSPIPDQRPALAAANLFGLDVRELHDLAPSSPPPACARRCTALALEVVDRRDPATPPPSSLDERITATLAGAAAALPFAELRACCRVRATTLYERLAVLAETGRVVKTDDGYRLADG